MKKFCRECGQEANQDDLVCRNCGTAFKSSHPKRAEQQKMPKKKKVMITLLTIIAVLIIGFSTWATKYHSAEAVKDRFDNLVNDEKAGKLASYMIHQNGMKLTRNEAKAFISLSKSETGIDDLYSVVEDGKFLGLFKNHKIEVIDQYATYDKLEKGLSFLFNKDELNGETEGNTYI